MPRRIKAAVEPAAKRTALFAAGVMALVCLASWMIAYLEPTIAANVQGVCSSWDQALSRERILTYSAFGGLGLVVIEYFITRWMVKFARFM